MAVDSKTQYVLSYALKDGTIASINAAMKILRQDYTTRGHRLRIVRFDGGKSFVSEILFNKLKKHGIRPQVASPQRHARKAERSIRYVKSLMRATIVDLKFKLPCMLITHLWKWCIDSMNLHLRSSNDYLTPHSLFTDQPISIGGMFRARFGEIVEVLHVPDATTRDSTPKTITGIVVGRDPNFMGQFLILNISKQLSISDARLLRRHQIAIREPPPDINEILKSLGSSISFPDQLILDESSFGRDENHDAVYKDVGVDASTESSADSDEESIEANSSTHFAKDSDSKWVKDPFSMPDVSFAELSSSSDSTFSSSSSSSVSMPNSNLTSLLSDTNNNSTSLPASDVHVLNPDAHEILKQRAPDMFTSPAHNSIISTSDSAGGGNDQRDESAESDDRPATAQPQCNKSKSIQKSVRFELDIDDFVYLADLKRRIIKDNERCRRTPRPSAKERERQEEHEERKRRKINKVELANFARESIISATVKEFYQIYGAELTDVAVYKELKQMLDKRVWEFITPDELKQLKSTRRINVLPSMTLMKAKFDAFKELEKIKARLCACGNLQRFTSYLEGKEPFDISAPTASAHSLLLSLAIAAKLKLNCMSFDVSGAFLNATLPEEEFMSLNKHLSKMLVENDESLRQYLLEDGTMVVRLKKSLYGLRQAPMLWYQTVSKVIIEELHFSRCSLDKCLFYKRDANNALHILVLYVDDFLILSSDKSMFEHIHQVLIKNFDEVTKKEGDKLSFLGLQITRDVSTNDYSVSLEGFISKIQEDHALVSELVGVKARTPWSTPHFTSNTKFSPHGPIEDLSASSEAIDPELVKLFRSKVMTAMYIAVKARPEVLVGTTMLATKQLRPDAADFLSINRILKYLIETKERKLIFRSRGAFSLQAFVDAAFQRYLDSKGHGGWAIFLDAEESSPFYWRSKKQSVITSSPQDAEAVELEECFFFVRSLLVTLGEMGISTYLPIFHEDNENLVNAVNSDHNDKAGGSKRTNASQFIVQDAVINNEIVVKWI